MEPVPGGTQTRPHLVASGTAVHTELGSNPMRSIPRTILTRILAAALLTVAATPAAEVDAERLNTAHSDTDNWLTYYGNYLSWRYSPLDAINRSNIKDLRPVWAFESGMADGGMQSAPIVVDGVMYVATAWNHVFALDAVTGEQLWALRLCEAGPVPDPVRPLESRCRGGLRARLHGNTGQSRCCARP